jgi:diphosphomevalonate decarboxylase
VKYWGKKGRQIPVNPSLSMSLSHSYTETTVKATKSVENTLPELSFYFEGQKNEAFEKKIHSYLNQVSEFFPWLSEVSLHIESRNTFPHSTGIASSASSYSALALCLCSLDAEINGILPDEDEFRYKASYLARLGSGSACRSVFGGFTLWGLTNALQDAIIVVNQAEKPVSSSEGHRRMQGHPFAEARVKQARQHIIQLLDDLRNGEITSFMKIVENEALTLHALMMTSEQSFNLLLPETIAIINKVRAFRTKSGINICFTLDAGPNVHLLFFKNDFEQVERFIVEEINSNIKQKVNIMDGFGNGPVKIA